MPITQVSATLRRTEAYALVDAVSEREDLAATVSAHEADDGEHWVFEAGVEGKPDLVAFETLARELGIAVTFTTDEVDPTINWVARSLEGLQPVRAGGFYVYGSHTGGRPPPGLTPLHIEAALAFGTGHHETTTGCLEAIDRVLKRWPIRHAIDVGTGTGILAIALAKRLHRRIIASDIDPVATATADENARDNGVGPLIRAVTAVGVADQTIRAGAPYDLIVANILAGPLVQLAPAMCRLGGRGATFILSGILTTQARRVLSAYRSQGAVFRTRLDRKDWTTLILEKPAGRR